MMTHCKTRPAWAALLLATALFAPLAEAKCPKTIAGVWSGLVKLDSFQEGGGHTDQSVALGRANFSANGTYEGSLISRNSEHPSGEISPPSPGVYTFSATTCSGQLELGGSEYRFAVTNNGTMMIGILFRPEDATQKDSASFTMYRE
jgi:hypothetical protein